jgi:Flp pilus assembly protein TadG
MIPVRLRTFAGRLRRDRGGLAMIEFALSAPIVLAIGCYGTEMANLAMVNMRVSQIALNLADNASRVGAYSNLATQQLREVDINDILQAARYQGTGINLTTNGRITLSSLENVAQSYDTQPVQRIHWQRCIGLKSGAGFDSTYGITATNNVATGTTYQPNAGVDTDPSGNDNSSSHPGSLAPDGMGDAGAKVTAPGGAGVMFVEINYRTKPLFGTWLSQPQTIHYIASFVVRDRRDYTQVYNPSPGSNRSTCDLYTS